jgi:uncharacterized delta-60 repeat protein
MRPAHVVSSILIAAACGLGTAAQAAPGQLDRRFDGDGVVIHETATTPGGFDALSLGLIDAAGRYVGAGPAEVVDGRGGLVLRLLSNGSRDPGFGEQGVVRVPLLPPYPNIRWRDIERQPDGKLLLAGKAGNGGDNDDPGRAFLCRLFENGGLDPQFGDTGCVAPTLAPQSASDTLVAIALQPDGRILFTGNTDAGQPGFTQEFVVGRVNADGSPDLCFGDPTCQSGGVVIEPEPEVDLPAFSVWDVALAPDGRIVVTGVSNRDMAIVRLEPTGSVDATFGNGGHRLIAFDQGGQNNEIARSLVVRSDGSIVVTGIVETAFGYLGGLAALDAGGTPIASFGSGGKRQFFFNDIANQHYPFRLLELDDGTLLVGGYATDSFAEGDALTDCGAARFLADGTPDPAFGFNGVNSFDGDPDNPGSGRDVCLDIAVQGETIVLFGSREAGVVEDDAMMMRLDRDGLFRDGFESGG